MSTKRQTEVLIRGKLEIILKEYVNRKYDGRLASFTVTEDGSIRLFYDIELNEETESKEKLAAKTEIDERSRKKKIKEPECKVDDTILLYGIDEIGRESIEKYGHAWKIKVGGKERWYITPLLTRDSKKYFCGNEASPKKILSVSIPLEKDVNNIDRHFRVIAVCKFPKEFNAKKYHEALQKRGVNIREL